MCTPIQCPKVSHPCIWDRKLPYRGSGNFALFLTIVRSGWCLTCFTVVNSYSYLYVHAPEVKTGTVDPMKIQPRQRDVIARPCSLLALSCRPRHSPPLSTPAIYGPIQISSSLSLSSSNCRSTPPQLRRDTRMSKPRGGCRWSAEAVFKFRGNLICYAQETGMGSGPASRIRRNRIDPDRI
jgi:hypothetical protein